MKGVQVTVLLSYKQYKNFIALLSTIVIYLGQVVSLFLIIKSLLGPSTFDTGTKAGT
jgi:hypothetical protein